MNDYLAFARAAAERAVKTFAQTLAVLLGANQYGLVDAPWSTSLSLAAMAAVLSVLTSVASAPFGSPGPSLANEKTVAAPQSGQVIVRVHNPSKGDAGLTAVELCFIVIAACVVVLTVAALR